MSNVCRLWCNDIIYTSIHQLHSPPPSAAKHASCGSAITKLAKSILLDCKDLRNITCPIDRVVALIWSVDVSWCNVVDIDVSSSSFFFFDDEKLYWRILPFLKSLDDNIVVVDLCLCRYANDKSLIFFWIWVVLLYWSFLYSSLTQGFVPECLPTGKYPSNRVG